MDRKVYSKLYNEFKQGEREAMRDAMRKYQQENPERFAELQAQAKHELEHPPERPIIYPRALHSTFNVDEFVRLHHTQDYYIHTKDAFGDSHMYFEGLNNETPIEVLTRRHPKFVERSEKVIRVEKCACPLCKNLN